MLSLCPTQPVFYRAPAGSQVTLSSLGNQSVVALEERARLLLTEPERSTMNYYLQQYKDLHIPVQAFVIAMFELLNTQAKVTWKLCVYVLVYVEEYCTY